MKVPYKGNQNVYHQQVPYIAARGGDVHAGQVRRTSRAMCPTNMAGAVRRSSTTLEEREGWQEDKMIRTMAMI